MLTALAALLAAAQPAPSASPTLGRTAWLVATVGHSEWCPPGNLRLDLRSGQYRFAARASRRRCGDPRLERPVRSGTLAAARLAAVRSAYLRVLREGLTRPACRNGGRPDQIVIDNGGTPVLLVATGAATASAPDQLGCWSEAARALSGLLDRLFPAAG